MIISPQFYCLGVWAINLRVFNGLKAEDMRTFLLATTLLTIIIGNQVKAEEVRLSADALIERTDTPGRYD